MICQTNVGSGGSQLTFDPLNWKHLCLVGPNRVCLYNLEQCDTENFLSPMYESYCIVTLYSVCSQTHNSLQ